MDVNYAGLSMKPNPEINMKTSIKALVLTLSTSLIATPCLASDLSSMVGVWQTDDADGRVEIYDLSLIHI